MPLPPGFDRLAVAEAIYTLLHSHMASEWLRDKEEQGDYTRPDGGREAAEARLVQQILRVIEDEYDRVTQTHQAPQAPPTGSEMDGAGDDVDGD
jgi:hypothetical protein